MWTFKILQMYYEIFDSKFFEVLDSLQPWTISLMYDYKVHSRKSSFDI